MDWIKWVIPLLALLVWILANLARPQEERKPSPHRPPRPGDEPRPDGQSASTELDRFLRELERRRQEEERKRGELRKRADIPSVLPVGRARGPGEPRRSVPGKQSPRPALEEARSRRPMPSSEAARERPIPPPLPPREPTRAVQPQQARLPLPTAELVEAPDTAVAQIRSQVVAADSAYLLTEPEPPGGAGGIAAQVRQMLLGPDTARAALALREVLDRPLALRRGVSPYRG